MAARELIDAPQAPLRALRFTRKDVDPSLGDRSKLVEVAKRGQLEEDDAHRVHVDLNRVGLVSPASRRHIQDRLASLEAPAARQYTDHLGEVKIADFERLSGLRSRCSMLASIAVIPTSSSSVQACNTSRSTGVFAWRWHSRYGRTRPAVDRFHHQVWKQHGSVLFLPEEDKKVYL